jgi:hypothetical protein
MATATKTQNVTVVEARKIWLLGSGEAPAAKVVPLQYSTMR